MYMVGGHVLSVGATVLLYEYEYEREQHSQEPRRSMRFLTLAFYRLARSTLLRTAGVLLRFPTIVWPSALLTCNLHG